MMVPEKITIPLFKWKQLLVFRLFCMLCYNLVEKLTIAFIIGF